MEPNQPRYPHVTVPLTGAEGNAFALLALVCRALHEHDVPEEEIERFMTEAMAGGYDQLLRTVMAWVEVK